MQADLRDAPSATDTATCWRMRAEEVRTLADDVADATVRAMMLRTANDYDRRAELVEECKSSLKHFNGTPSPPIMDTEDHLAKAERRVREGALRLERQRKRVAELKNRGLSAEVSSALLAQFKITLALQIGERNRLLKLCWED